MAEELEDKNKRISSRSKKYHYKPIDEEILSKSVLKLYLVIFLPDNF